MVWAGNQAANLEYSVRSILFFGGQGVYRGVTVKEFETEWWESLSNLF